MRSDAGPRGRDRWERCACGGVIEAAPGGIEAAVREHNRTPTHRRWREREGIDPPEQTPRR
jgi:hypothetical protein